MGVFRLVRQLIHWGPIVALTIILFISGTAVHCMMMYWPLYTDGGIIHFLVFLMWIFLILYNYFLAAFKGPGFVPYEWKPVRNYLFYPDSKISQIQFNLVLASTNGCVEWMNLNLCSA